MPLKGIYEEVDYKEFKAIVADQVKATPCRDWSNLTIVSLVDRIYYFMNVQAAKAQLKKHCSRFWSEVEEGNDSATKILSRAKHLLGLVNLVVESHAVTQIIQRNIIKQAKESVQLSLHLESAKSVMDDAYPELPPPEKKRRQT